MVTVNKVSRGRLDPQNESHLEMNAGAGSNTTGVLD